MNSKFRTWGRRATTVALSLAMVGGGFPTQALTSVAYAQEDQVESTLGNGFEKPTDIYDAEEACFEWRVEIEAQGIEKPRTVFVPSGQYGDGPDYSFIFGASEIVSAFYEDGLAVAVTTAGPQASWNYHDGNLIPYDSYVIKAGNDYKVALPMTIDVDEAATLVVPVKDAETGGNFAEKTFTFTVSKVYNLAKATVTLKLDGNNMPQRTEGDNPYYTTYTGAKIEPVPTVTATDDTPIDAKSYTVAQGDKDHDNTNVSSGGIVTVKADDKDEVCYGTNSKTFEIDKREITASWDQETLSTEYDGSPQSPDVTVQAVGEGFVGTLPSLTITQVKQNPSDPDAKDVGEYTFSAALDAEENPNFELQGTLDNTSFTITPKPITVTGLTFEKEYDGEETATLNQADFTNATAEGVCKGDSITIAMPTATEGISAKYDNKNAGSDKTVTVSGQNNALDALINGEAKGNYTLGATFEAKGTITPKTLTVENIKAEDKVYDATKTATLTKGKAGLDGVIDADEESVRLAKEPKGEFKSASAGEKIPVKLTAELTLTSTDPEGHPVSNYEPVMAEGQELTATITKAPLTVIANDQTVSQNDAIATDEGQYYAKGLKGEDKLASAKLTSTSTAKPTTSGKITPSDAKVEGVEGDNYKVEYVDGKLTVVETPAVTYSAHVQKDGDVGPVTSGPCGTTDQSKRLEAISATVDGGSIEYRSHVQGTGWEKSWAKDGAASGTTHQSRRIEAIQMRLTGEAAKRNSVWYRVHSQTYGWLGWACDGEPAGTANMAKRAEAYEVVVLPQGQTPKGYDAAMPAFRAQATGHGHVQGIGWQATGAVGKIGTTGQSKRIEALTLEAPAALTDVYAGGIEYRSHVQGTGWEKSWVKDGAVSGTTGQRRRAEAVRIRLTDELGREMSVWYRVHSQTFGWSGWTCDGEPAGSQGYGKRAEAVEMVILPRGAAAPGSTANAFRAK